MYHPPNTHFPKLHVLLFASSEVLIKRSNDVAIEECGPSLGSVGCWAVVDEKRLSWSTENRKKIFVQSANGEFILTVEVQKQIQ